jgi:hypothetical protein
MTTTTQSPSYQLLSKEGGTEIGMDDENPSISKQTKPVDHKPNRRGTAPVEEGEGMLPSSGPACSGLKTGPPDGTTQR